MCVWLLPLSLFLIGLILILLTSHFHPSLFPSLIEHSCQTCCSTFYINICPSYVAYVSAATLRWRTFCPFLLSHKTFTDIVARTNIYTQTQTHKHLSAFSLSTCDVCSLNPGGGRWGVSSDLIALRWSKCMIPLKPLTASYLKIPPYVVPAAVEDERIVSSIMIFFFVLLLSNLAICG